MTGRRRKKKNEETKKKRDHIELEHSTHDFCNVACFDVPAKHKPAAATTTAAAVSAEAAPISTARRAETAGVCEPARVPTLAANAICLAASAVDRSSRIRHVWPCACSSGSRCPLRTTATTGSTRAVLVRVRAAKISATAAGASAAKRRITAAAACYGNNHACCATHYPDKCAAATTAAALCIPPL